MQWRITTVGFCFAAAACQNAPAPAPASSGPAIDSDIPLKPETVLVAGLVPPNATLDALLRTHGLATDVVNSLIGAARTVFDPRHLRASQPFELVRTLDGGLRRFGYEIDAATPSSSRWPKPGVCGTRP